MLLSPPCTNAFLKTPLLFLLFSLCTNAGIGKQSERIQTVAHYQVETEYYRLETVVLANGSSVIVSIDKQKGVRLCCRLKNQQGKTIFCKKLTRRQTNGRFVLNMSHLADGVYLLYVQDGVTPITQVIRKPNWSWLESDWPNTISWIGGV